MGVHKKFGNPGEKYGRLTIIGEAESKIEPSGRKKRQVICNCDCGSNNIVIPLEQLRSGKTKSCGCYNKEKLRERSKKFNTYELDYKTNIGKGLTDKEEPFYFDIDDYDKIKEYCWHLDDKGYIISNEKNHGKVVRMHRLVMNCPEDKIVDHIDHKKNNNCKSNLRICTTAENNRNKSLSKNNKSGVHGVRWDKRSSKWKAEIIFNRKIIHLGYFKTIEEAAKARKEAEIKYFGEFACTES